jgi:hypothetical protein
MDLAVK